MAKAITILASGMRVGLSMLGRHGDGRGSPIQQVHDGDTIVVEAAGNLSVRFLGVDTPEVSFTLPGSSQFRSVGGADWDQFLTDPFAGAPNEFTTGLGNGLLQYLQGAIGQGCASNHAHHAEQAHRHLEQLVTQDMRVLGQDRPPSISSWYSPMKSWTGMGGSSASSTATRSTPICRSLDQGHTTRGCWKRGWPVPTSSSRM